MRTVGPHMVSLYARKSPKQVTKTSTHTHRLNIHTVISHSSMYPLNFTLDVTTVILHTVSVSVVGSSLIILLSNKDHYSSHGGVALPTCMRQQYICQYQPVAVRLFIYLLLLFPLWDCILLFATGNHFSCFTWALQRHNECWCEESHWHTCCWW